MKLHKSYAQITDNLYIGDMWSSTTMIEHGIKQQIKPITHIISLIPLTFYNKKFIENNQIKYHQYLFNDSLDEDIIMHFNNLKETIKKYLIDEQGTLLCMCQAGKSRSVSIVILILMHFYQMTFSEAKRLVESKKEIQINNRFYRDLSKYRVIVE